MATLTTTARQETERIEVSRASRFSFSRLLSPALLTPSFIAILVFVYGFIGFTIWVSASNWRTNRRDLSLHTPIYGVYQDLLNQSRFQIDLRNTFVFTLIFLVFGRCAWSGSGDFARPPCSS